MRTELADWNLTRVNTDMSFAKEKYVVAGREEYKHVSTLHTRFHTQHTHIVTYKYFCVSQSDFAESIEYLIATMIKTKNNACLHT